MSAAAETARIEMEAARTDVADCEEDIRNIKAALKKLPSDSGAEDDEAPNSLRVAVLKVSHMNVSIVHKRIIYRLTRETHR